MNKDRLINEFIELVQIDSETGYEAEISKVLHTKFQALGLDIKEDEAATKINHTANNMICHLKGDMPNAPRLFFTAHMDTVTPGKGIKPQIDGDYITSDGTTILGADDKAGIAVIFEVIRQLKEQKLSHGDIQFVITVGEESSLAGAKVLDASLLQADYGYALDSDGAIGSIVTTAPYHAKIRSVISGKSAHAGVAPEKGVSAITVAAKSVAKMKLGRIDEETTANIGYFQGGKSTETNVVVDTVEIVAEARSLSEQKLTDLTAQMQKAVEETANQFGGKADVDIEVMYPGFHYTASDHVVQLAQQAATKLGLPSTLLQSGGGSDANIFNGYGIPTVNLSVGYEHIHTTKERIHTDHLVDLTGFVLGIIGQAAEQQR